MAEGAPPLAVDRRRGSPDVLWFALLIVSLLAGFGMTIFAPDGSGTPNALEGTTTQPIGQGAP